MTAINGPILFNAVSGGSDTAASGVGPATPVSGTGASTSSSSPTVDLSADSPDLSGVSAGDLFWVDSSSGRQFSVIASVDDGADTIVCDDSFANTESGRNWGIGGKRATFESSRQLFDTDMKAEWVAETESDQSISTVLEWHSGGTYAEKFAKIVGTAGAKRTITQTGSNEDVIWCDDGASNTVHRQRFENLKFESSHANSGEGLRCSGNGQIHVVDCEIGDETNSLNNGWVRSGNTPSMVFRDCWFHHCESHGVDCYPTSAQMKFINCVFSHNAGAGIETMGSVFLDNCTFYGNNYGIYVTHAQTNMQVNCCTIHNNDTDGVRLTVGYVLDSCVFYNCNITGNGAYGIRSDTETEIPIKNCNFGAGVTANTSGATTSNISDCLEDCLTVDPGYADAGNADFAVGANVKAQGFPGDFPDGNSTGYLDIGAVQREEPAGGSAQAKLRRLIHIAEGVL